MCCQDSKGVSIRLSKQVPSFAYVPIAQSECAIVLRLANVQNHIFNVLCEFAMNPFFSLHHWLEHGKNENISETYANMAQYGGEEVQRRWKVSTLKVLQQLDNPVDTSEIVGKIVDREIVGALYELVEERQTDQLKYDLKGIFTAAVELGRSVESDEVPMSLERVPSMSERDGWREYSTEKYEADEKDDAGLKASTLSVPREPLCVQPKILRRRSETAEPTPTSTSTSGKGAIEVIQAGVALFPDTGIFQDGAAQWKEIHNAGIQAATNVGARKGSLSRTTTMTSIGVHSPVVALRSPTLPSRVFGVPEYT